MIGKNVVGERGNLKEKEKSIWKNKQYFEAESNLTKLISETVNLLASIAMHIESC